MKRREGRGKFKPKRRKRGNGSTIFRFRNGLESEYTVYYHNNNNKNNKSLISLGKVSYINYKTSLILIKDQIFRDIRPYIDDLIIELN